MEIPANAAAREIARLRDINKDVETQIRELRDRQLENSEMIGALSPSAEWGEPPAPEPEPEPEPELEPEPEIPTEESPEEEEGAP